MTKNTFAVNESCTNAYAIVAFLWLKTDEKEVAREGPLRFYNKARGLIADALTLGASLEYLEASKILMISPEVRFICGASLLQEYWELREVEPVLAHQTWFGRCETRFQGTFTKLRALELIEFRKVVIMDLDMIVRDVKRVAKLFNYETPAACFRGNGKRSVAQPRCFGSQPIRGGRMIGGINAGLMILTPSKTDFEFMINELKKENPEPTCGPEQDYLSRFYPEWISLPLEFNFQLHQLGHLAKQVKSWEQPERRMPFEDIAIIHYSGNYTPRESIFEENNVKNFESWVEENLIHKYGRIDDVDRKTFEACIYYWHIIWQRVIGRILAQHADWDATAESLTSQMVTCKPWVDEDMIFPRRPNKCLTCRRWESSRMQSKAMQGKCHEKQNQMNKTNSSRNTNDRRQKGKHHEFKKKYDASRQFDKIHAHPNVLKSKDAKTLLTPKHAMRSQSAGDQTQRENTQTKLLYPTVKLRQS